MFEVYVDCEPTGKRFDDASEAAIVAAELEDEFGQAGEYIVTEVVEVVRECDGTVRPKI